MTGTSTRTPTTVASAAPEAGPKSVIATATASSKKLLAPMSAPGEATLCSTLNTYVSRAMLNGLCSQLTESVTGNRYISAHN